MRACGRITLGAEVCTAEWHLLPSLHLTFHRTGGRRHWMLVAGWLCVAVWAEGGEE